MKRKKPQQESVRCCSLYTAHRGDIMPGVTVYNVCRATRGKMDPRCRPFVPLRTLSRRAVDSVTEFKTCLRTRSQPTRRSRAEPGGAQPVSLGNIFPFSHFQDRRGTRSRSWGEEPCATKEIRSLRQQRFPVPPSLPAAPPGRTNVRGLRRQRQTPSPHSRIQPTVPHTFSGVEEDALVLLKCLLIRPYSLGWKVGAASIHDARRSQGP